MSSSTFKINKICEQCGGLFQAQKISTRCCSHKCNQKNYKLRKKLEKKKIIELETLNNIVSVKSDVVNIHLLKDKPYLTVKEVATLLNCSNKTIYRLIKQGNIDAVRFSERVIRIRYVDIEKRFLNTTNF
ncbi:MAG: helix-turn-helix domain-containing protein [Flavobacteriaceae bacterium]|nr:helix-turn-helix domain-containing protein [Flavobacteriaceae bacterium]